MQMNEKTICPECSKTGFIFVDSYEDKLLTGRIYYRETDEQKQFCNLVQLLFHINEATEALNLTESGTALKKFTNTQSTQKINPDETGKKNNLIKSGKLATFLVKVIFRQNCSWQGIVSWVEGKKEESFRSELELIALMDSALESSANKDEFLGGKENV